MRIAVINGSPKGKDSVTLQYIEYLKKMIKSCDFIECKVVNDIKKIENNNEAFKGIIETVSSSDGVLWCFPLYILLVPSQLKRFIELIFENSVKDVFKDKYATALTTSIHFYDHTAHNYIHSVSEDLNMKYVPGYSAKMNDLLKPLERKNILSFAQEFLRFIDESVPVTRDYPEVSYDMPPYIPEGIVETPKTGSKKVLLVTDSGERDVNLNRMIETFVKLMPNKVDTINLNEINLRGGCLGCLKCGYDGICVYKDDMMDVFTNKLLPADIVIYAGSINDRFLSSRWKMFIDRMFFNGHRPVLEGQYTGYIISGPLRDISNMRQVLDAFGEVGRVNNVGIITDEYDDSSYVTSLIDDFAKRLLWAAQENITKPITFLGVGGHAVLRDFIYYVKFIFRADHEYYKTHNLYNFPQKAIKMRARNAFILPLLRIPKVRERFKKETVPQMIKPFQKVLKE